MAWTAHRDSPALGGLKLPERYEILRRIADGGMASVWCAHDRLLGRNVALKLLADPFAHQFVAVRRFMREARTAARLSGHPHVVTIYDVGQAIDPDEPLGRPFLVMEYLAGGTVADARRVGEVTVSQAIRWLHEAASALDYAHGRGVIHRDIKPGNFLLDCDRVLHVADFGIAQLGGEETIGGTGEILGTAAYLDPERALGSPATEASDRYALAVVAFELLVGDRPYPADQFAAQAQAHVEQEVPRASARNRSLPRAVDAVLSRGMAKRPQDRFTTAAEFAGSLEAALATAVGRASPVGRAAPVGRASPVGRAAPVGRATPVGRASRTGRASRSGRTASGARTAPIQGRRPPPMAAAPSQRQPRRGLAVAALAAAALAVGLAAALTAGSSHPRPAPTFAGVSTTSHSRPAPRHAVRKRAGTRQRHSPSSPATTPRPTATTPRPTASSLEARGHQLMDEGSYQAAIAVLRRAVAAAAPDSLTYDYALFDLGRSLRLAGDPRDAIPILWRRMQIPNQTAVVREELQLALQALGQSVQQSWGSAGPSASRPHDHGNGPPGGQQGGDQGD